MSKHTQENTKPEFDWTGIVNQSVDAWPEPTPLPTGHWQFTVRAGKFDKAKGTTLLVLQPTSPMEDVNTSEVEKFGDLSSASVFARFRMNNFEDISRLKQLIRALGLGEYSIEDALKAVKGAPVAGEVTHSPRDDGTDGVYVNVRRLGPIAA